MPAERNSYKLFIVAKSYNKLYRVVDAYGSLRQDLVAVRQACVFIIS